MTLKELYSGIGEDYEQALRVLRVEKLVDKHIRKLTKNGLIETLLEAGKSGDSARLFDAAHAAKGNCGNLGLTRLCAAASEIAEEFRPGNPRTVRPFSGRAFSGRRGSASPAPSGRTAGRSLRRCLCRKR